MRFQLIFFTAAFLLNIDFLFSFYSLGGGSGVFLFNFCAEVVVTIVHKLIWPNLVTNKP
jgi:hypothetical protein